MVQTKKKTSTVRILIYIVIIFQLFFSVYLFWNYQWKNNNENSSLLLLTERKAFYNKPKRYAIVTLAVKPDPGKKYSLDSLVPPKSTYRKWLQDKIDYCMMEENECDVFIETMLDPLLDYPELWLSPMSRDSLSNAVYYQKQKAVKKVLDNYNYEWVFYVDLDTELKNPSIKLSQYTSNTDASLLIVDRPLRIPNAACFMIKNDKYGKKFLSRWISLELHPFFQEDNGALGFLLGDEIVTYKNITVNHPKSSRQYLDTAARYWIQVPFPGRYHPRIRTFDEYSSIRPFCVRLTSNRISAEPTYKPGDFIVHRKP